MEKRMFRVEDLVKHISNNIVVEIRNEYEQDFVNFRYDDYILVCPNEMRLDK